MDHWKMLFPKQIFELSYEDLVSDLEILAHQLLEHLELEWEADVLQFQELKRAVKTASVWQVRQPVYRSSLNRWEHYREELSPLEKVLSQPQPVTSAPAPAPAPEESKIHGSFSNAMDLLRIGKVAAAEALLLDLLSQRPNHAAARHFLGVALFMQGRREAARQEMTQSLQLISHHPTWWENLAAVERELGNHDAASASMAEAKKRFQNWHLHAPSTQGSR
jgi:TolA-binding protein